MMTKRQLIEHLQRLGLRAGDSVVVHASYKAIGPVEGGAASVIEALLDSVGSSGTVLLPNLNIPHEFTATNPPRFDLQQDRIQQWVGIIPQVFKDRYAQHFSRHPTHSIAAAGAQARLLTADHELAQMPCGPGTPWWRNATGAAGRVLLIGVTQHRNTTYHAAEEAVSDSYRLSADLIRGIVVDRGQELEVRSRLHRWGIPADFNRLNEALESSGGLKMGQVGSAPSMLIDGRAFMELAMALLKKDRSYFLESPPPRE